MRASVTVRVAGSTSNLGAGFDCVGVAVGRWLRVTARVSDAAGKFITIERGGTLGALDTAPEADLLYRGFVAACRRCAPDVPAGHAAARGRGAGRREERRTGSRPGARRPAPAGRGAR